MSDPVAVADISGCWRVEGRLPGTRSPLSWVGVASTSRSEGYVNGPWEAAKSMQFDVWRATMRKLKINVPRRFIPEAEAQN